MTLAFEVLRTIGLLAGEPPAAAEEFSGLGRTKTLPKGHVVWRMGQSPDAIVVPLDGEIAEVGWGPGGRAICYAFFGTGDCAGIPAVLDGLPQPRDVRVIRGGEFFVLERAAFLRFLDARPAVRARATTAVARLLRASMEQRDRDVFLPVYERVARFLIERACVRRCDGARILLRETQPEIAIRLGSVREVVSREMANFGSKGLIRRTRHALFVADWSALWETAGCGRDSTCTCEADSAALRTKRFFVPAFSQGTVPDEVRVCGEHVSSFRECVARGCPLAAAPRGPGASPCDDVGNAPRVRSALAHPRGAAAGPGTLPGTAAVAEGCAPPARVDGSEAVPTDDRVRRKTEILARLRLIDEAAPRTSADEHEIRRRVALYRRRASGIASKFTAEDRVPLTASVFSERADTER